MPRDDTGDGCIPHPSLSDDVLIAKSPHAALLITTMLLSSCCECALTGNVCDVVFVLTPGPGAARGRECNPICTLGRGQARDKRNTNNQTQTIPHLGRIDYLGK